VIAAPHLAAGFVAGMAGAYVRGPVAVRATAAFVIGLLSHVLLDAVPHSDYGMVERSTIPLLVLAEGLVTGAIAAAVLRRRLPRHWPLFLFSGIAGSGLLDAKFVARLLLPAQATDAIARRGDWIHGFFHSARMSQPLIGLAIEVAVTIAFLLLLTAFPRTSPRPVST
jgi:hypothetical protein